MPSPSKPALFVGIALTIGMFFSGAYLASNIPTRSTTAAPSSKTASLQQDAAAAAMLEVGITGLQGTEGDILILVFEDAAAFETYDLTQLVGYAEFDAAARPAKYSFAELSGGPYVVSVLHDANGNQDLDFRGDMPLEGYGTSGIEDPYTVPSFSEAAVAAGPVLIQMHYLK